MNLSSYLSAVFALALFACDATPAARPDMGIRGGNSCAAAGSVAEGGACECASDCAGDAICSAGRCGSPCFDDEGCGADECRVDLDRPGSCQPPPEACAAQGDGVPGAECGCNADCGPDAPFCLAFSVDGTPGRACAAPCGPEQPCPSGSVCCGTAAYCVPEGLSASLGCDGP